MSDIVLKKITNSYHDVFSLLQNKLNNFEIHWLMMAIFISAPYFYFGQNGVDFINRDRISLVDIFLLFGFANACIRFIKKQFIIPKEIKILIFLGSIFFIWSLIAAVVGSHYYQALNINSLFSGAFQYALILIGFPFIAACYLQNKVILTIKLICLAYFPPMVFNLLLTPDSSPPFLRTLFFQAGRALGTYGNANSFSLVLIIVLPLYLYLTTLPQRSWKMLGLLGVVCSLLCLIETMSFSGFIVFSLLILINVVIFVWMRPKRLFRSLKNGLILIIAIVVITGTALFYIAPNEYELMNHRLYLPIKKIKLSPKITLNVIKFGSFTERTELMKKAIMTIKARHGAFLYGHGLNNTQYFKALYPTEKIRASNYALPIVHNVFLLLWLEGGMLLMLIFLIYFICLCYYNLRYLKINPALSWSIFTSVLGFMLYAMLSVHVYLRCYGVPLLAAFAFISTLRKTDTGIN